MSHLQKLGGASLVLSALASVNIGFFQQPAQASLLTTTLSFSMVSLIHPSADAKSLDCIHSGINCPQVFEKHSVNAPFFSQLFFNHQVSGRSYLISDQFLRGTYLKTCRDIRRFGNERNGITLRAICQRTNRPGWDNTQLEHAELCVGDIKSINGILQCNYQSNPVPPKPLPVPDPEPLPVPDPKPNRVSLTPIIFDWKNSHLIYTLDAKSKTDVQTISKDFPSGITSSYPLAISPDGNLFASAGLSEIRLWNMRMGKQTTYTLTTTEGYIPIGIHSIAFSADGTLLVIASNSSFLQKNPLK